MRLAVATTLGLLSLGCTSSGGEARDANLIRLDSGIDDGGRCSAVPLTASCQYEGYGTACPVPCSFPPDCTFEVDVSWSGNGYCCGWEGTHLVDCRCESGGARCIPAFSPTSLPHEVPRTYCEFCSVDAFRIDAGP